MELQVNRSFSGKKLTQKLLDNVIIIGILFLAIGVSFIRPNFASAPNIRNLLTNTAVRFIIALGVSGCLITKGTDLSAGRTAGLAACISAIMLQKGDYAQKVHPNIPELPILLVVVGVVVICAIIGMVNGTVVSIFKVPPFIATLGMQLIVYGICLVYTGASPIGGLRRDYTQLATGYIEHSEILTAILVGLIMAWMLYDYIKNRQKKRFYGLVVLAAFALLIVLSVSFGLIKLKDVVAVTNAVFSYVALIAFAVGFLMWFLYNKTRHGKYMYAIGGNETAAEVAGVNCTRMKIKIYMLAGMLYGLCGFLIGCRAGGASVNTAMGYELEAIAGCTIGGVSVNGGVGKISGILIGVLVFELLKIAMQFLGIETSYTYIVQGLVIIIAVALDLRKYLAKK